MSSNANYSSLRLRRAACDRCHELKSRCTKEKVSHPNCDRCRRLGLNCVYSAPSRMGRPRGKGTKIRQQATASNELNDMGQGFEDELNTINNNQYFATNQAEPMESTLNGDDPRWEDDRTMLADIDSEYSIFLEANGGLDPSLDLLHAAGDTPQANILGIWTGPLPQSQDERGDLSCDVGNSSQEAIEDDPHRGDNMINFQLSQLQLQLQRLMESYASDRPQQKSGLGSGDKSVEADHSLSETLIATEKLMVLMGKLKRDQSTHSLPLTDSDVSWLGLVVRDTKDITTLLLVVTCYMNLLQIYGTILASMHSDLQKPVEYSRGPGLPNSCTPSSSVLSSMTFTFGQFNLTSHPQLKAQVITHLVSSMLKPIQQSVKAAIFNNPSMERAEERNSAPVPTEHNNPCFRWHGKQRLPDLTKGQSMSRLLAADVVQTLYEEEEKVFERLDILGKAVKMSDTSAS